MTPNPALPPRAPAANEGDILGATRGISVAQAHLVNIGMARFEVQQYEKAFFSFQASLQAHDMLTANNQTSVLAEPGQHDQTVQVMAASARLEPANIGRM